MLNDKVISDSDNQGEAVSSRPKAVRNPEKSIQKYRLLIQLAFGILCIWIGVEFHFFVRHLESGGTTTFISRPPGVEGFLPISSLMSLYYFFQTGTVHPAHPAGLFILVAIVLVSVVFGKAFCSWLCPVGLISEVLGDLGEKIFRRKIIMPRILDYPLRSIKYLLLGFFVYVIFIAMNAAALRAFLDTPYNLTADIKMYYFFADITPFALGVIVILMLLSAPIRGFWCRYLCPYGGLLGLLSLLSPHKIRRNAATCIDCNKCARVCPSFIKVDKIKTVLSDECTSCMACVDVCPVADTLDIKSVVTRKKVSKKWAAIATVSIFVAITGAAMLTGHWRNQITTNQYLELQKDVRSYDHPTNSRDLSRMTPKAIEDNNNSKEK